jgi:hypothetical protein
VTDDISSSEEIDRADWHKHLDYVQSIISRRANNSFVMKGWALTVTLALLGFASTRSDAMLALLATMAVAAFWFLDAYFLRQERAFRLMFADVAAKKLTAFILNPTSYAKKISWWKTIRSLSLSVFYGALLMLSLALAATFASSAASSHGAPQSSPVPSVTRTS